MQQLEIQSSSCLGVCHDRRAVKATVGPAGSEKGIEVGVEVTKQKKDSKGGKES